MDDDRTPQQIADWDQAHATVSASLDLLIEGYRGSLADGEPRDLTAAGICIWLRENLDTVLAEHLTVAIQRLAERSDG